MSGARITACPPAQEAPPAPEDMQGSGYPAVTDPPPPPSRPERPENPAPPPTCFTDVGFRIRPPYQPRRRNCFSDVGFRMRAAYKPRFVKRGGDVDPAVQEAVEQAIEARRIALHHLPVVLREFGQQEETEHAAFAVGAERHPVFRGGRLE